ncbi:hypothetical protein M5D96_005859 [Drosophila gunungcola]|uniref:Uncharacterized protein n=1 Tax=Drosophila gunungcola TaxID=103775 RepID=A0A9P9YRZ3_9MUSC|nr:hypothetical protein M5D96_005859 [Drosophila gunungcola]
MVGGPECLTCDMDMSSKCRCAQLKQMKRESSPGSGPESESENRKEQLRLVAASSVIHNNDYNTISFPQCDVCWKILEHKIS